MRLQVLVSAMHADARELAEKMNLQTDALIVNQCDHYAYETFERNGRSIRCLSMAERGVGLSRNTALMRADAELCLFGDEDIVYEPGYEKTILEEFEKHPEADVLLFNVKVCEERRTYWNTAFGRVHAYNSGRYPAYSIAAKRDGLIAKNLTFHLCFGGGAKYSNGEDSLFLRDAARAGLRIYKTPALIGEEIPRPSTWFHGFDDKFFYDRGVLYGELYGPGMAYVRAVRWLRKNKSEMCAEYPYAKALAMMKKGWRDGILP
ncbi:MAG: glycosyltransferase family 2 protein [Lachnospiraceae bacterium]|nr:glycosyltransferase family 2 protein [Lachnospiraceae bacterium]